MSSANTTATTAANGAPLPPLPKDHLDHPENWATGGEPATNSQKGFIKVLEGKKPELVPEGGVQLEGLSKSEGSEVIEKLKSGEKVEQNTDKEDEKGGKEGSGTSAAEVADKTAHSSRLEEPVTTKSDDSPSKSSSSKRKTTSDATAAPSSSSAEAPPTDADKKDDTMQIDSETPFAAEPAQKKETSNGKTEEAATAETETDRPAKKAKTDTESTESKKGETTGSGNGNGHAASFPPADNVVTPPAEPVDQAAEAEMKEAEKAEETVPGDGHLEHPENWATGDEPATDKQKGFIKVLEKQKGAAAASAAGDVENLGKSEASEKIDELKSM